MSNFISKNTNKFAISFGFTQTFIYLIKTY